MKKLVVMALLAFSIGANAQERGQKDFKNAKDVEAKWEALNLTADQKAKIEAVKAKYRPQQSKEGERPSREEIQKRKTEMDQEIKQILTREQYEKYENLNQRSKRRESAGTEMKKLNLSQTQKEQLMALRTDQHKLMKENKLKYNAELKNILSAEQYQQLKEGKKQDFKRHKKHLSDQPVKEA